MTYDFEAALGNIEKQRNGQPPEPTPPVTAPNTTALDTLGTSLQRAATANPVDESKRRKLSSQLNMPTAIMPPTADAESQAFLKNTKAQEIMAKYPSLAQWAQNPDNAAVAGKDLPTLGPIEETAKSLPQVAFGYGKNIAGSAAAAFPNANAAIWSFVQAAGAILSTNVTKPLANAVGTPDVGSLLSATALDMRQRATQIGKDIAPDMSGLGTVERGVYSGVQSAATSLMMLPLSVATGSPAPMLAGLSGITAGGSLGEAMDKGLPLNEALIHATKQGLIEYGTELFPVGNLLKNLTAKTGLLKTASEFMVREGIGEQAATVLQDLDKWATLNPEKPFSEYIAERPEAALETLIATAVGGSIQVGGGKAVAKGIDLLQRSTLADMGKADQAEKNRDVMMGLGEQAAAHPLRERDPQAFHDFMETMGEDGQSDVYVDGAILGEVLNQSGIPQDQIAAAMPEVAQQLMEAQKTGGEVRISLADYATYIAGTPAEKGIIDHLRASPEGMTYTEAQQFYQSQKEDLSKQAEKIMAENTKVLTPEEFAAKPELAEVGTYSDYVAAHGNSVATYQADLQQVHDGILDQMNKAGRFTKEVNAAYAVPFREFYAVNAARMGVSPSELYKQMPLNFAPMNKGDVLNQAVFHGTPHVWAPEEGFPHGRPRLDKMGTGEGAQAYGWGWYSAENKDVAGEYHKVLTDAPVSRTDRMVTEFGSEEKAIAETKRRLENYKAMPQSDKRDTFIKFQEEILAEFDRRAKGESNPGSLYSLDIPDSVLPRLLDWDKPLSEQSPEVQQGIAELRDVYGQLRSGNNALDGDMSGQHFYQLFSASTMAGSQQKASQEMAAAGIVGNRYLDGGSRADGKGTYNYVIWDQPTLDKIALLERNGEKLDAMRDLAQSPAIPQTETPAFKSWFGDSKVVDKDGKPLVVYHGTDKDVKAFRVKNRGLAYYFTPDADQASSYSGQKGANVIPVYLSVNKLYRSGDTEAEATILEAVEKADDYYPYRLPTVEDWLQTGNPSAFHLPSVVDAIRGMGYDGFVEMENGVEQYGIFNAKNIKSAIGNKGTFNPDSPGILDQENRAGYNPDTFTISLLKGADLSSTLHEGGHFYLEALAELASRPEAPQQIKDDFRKTLEWFGITGSENVQPGTRGGDLGQAANNAKAEAAGFDTSTVWMHGTTKNFKSFKVGDKGVNELGKGVYFTTSTTETYFHSRGETGRVINAYLKKGDMFDLSIMRDTGQTVGGRTEKKAAAYREIARRVKDRTDAITDPLILEWANQPLQDLADHIKKSSGQTDDLNFWLDKAGYIGATDSFSQYPNQAVVFDPKNIRSVDAKFDPKKADSRNIFHQGGEPGTPGDLPPGRTPEEVWASMTLDQKRPYHEQWAQSFERYMLEGKAPTTELQPVFARFKAWMLNVYKSLENFLKQNPLAGKLNDEVRGIFDRLIAAEESIRATESIRAYAPLFESAEAAGVTPKQFQEYLDLGDTATDRAIDDLSSRSLRDMRWLSNAKEKVIKDLQKEAKAKRKMVEAEVRQEVMAEPVEQARAFLKKGEITDPVTGEEVKAEAGFKLDKAAVAELYKGDTTKLRGMTEDGGISPDLAAQMFGFTSGEALVHELALGESAKDKIEAGTDQRMLERYGELSSEEDIERAAEAAIHNEARARFLATGLKILAKSPISASQLNKAAKEAAENTIASRKVRDLRPAQYERAETKANKEAIKLAPKDPKGAMSAQRAALLNNRLAKASGEAVQEVEKILRYVGRFQTEGTRKALDIDYMEQIDDLLKPFDFRKGQTLRQIDKRQSLSDWISEQEAMGFEPAIDPSLMDAAKQKSYKNMTMEELRGLVDSIKQIEHLGRLKNKLLLAKDQREFDAIVSEGMDAINANANRTVAEKATPSDAIGIASKWWRQMTADHRKFASIMREMDGSKDNGFMFNHFLMGMNEAGDGETQMKAEATEKLAVLFKAIKKDPIPGNLYAKKRVVPGTNLSMTHEQRIMFAMNWGNEGNRQRLLDGGLSGNRALSLPQANAILDTLTKEEWDFVQGVWDFIGGYKEQVAALERRLTGIEPVWIEAAPVQTKYGTYKGGYFPVKYDTELSSRSESLEAATDLHMGMKGAFNSAATRSGFTKARADQVINRPVLLSYNAIAQHVSEVTHRLSWQEWLVDSNRLLKALDNPIRTHYGAEILRTLRDTIVDIAAGDAPAKNGTETAINRLRVGSTVVGMGWRVTTALLQPSGLAQSWVRVGGRHMARGVYQFMKSPLTSSAFANSKSKMMVDRGRTMQREINEVLNTVRAGDKVSAFKASYFMLIGKMQRSVDIPTWLGAYDKATEELHLENAGSASEREAIEKQASALADQAVIDSQSGGQLKDLAKVQRGSPLQKIFTNFYSYFSATYNLNVEAVRRTNFLSPSQVALLATDMIILNTVPVLFSVALKEMLKGGCGDDLECLAGKLGHEQLNFLFGQMVLLREAGVAIDAATGGEGFGYQGPAGLRFFADLYKLGTQTQQGDADIAFFKSANQVAGAFLHSPAGQINATAEGIMAIESGKVDGMGILPALIAGPPKK